MATIEELSARLEMQEIKISQVTNKVEAVEQLVKEYTSGMNVRLGAIQVTMDEQGSQMTSLGTMILQMHGIIVRRDDGPTSPIAQQRTTAQAPVEQTPPAVAQRPSQIERQQDAVPAEQSLLYDDNYVSPALMTTTTPTVTATLSNGREVVPEEELKRQSMGYKPNRSRSKIPADEDILLPIDPSDDPTEVKLKQMVNSLVKGFVKLFMDGVITVQQMPDFTQLAIKSLSTKDVYPFIENAKTFMKMHRVQLTTMQVIPHAIQLQMCSLMKERRIAYLKNVNRGKAMDPMELDRAASVSIEEFGELPLQEAFNWLQMIVRSIEPAELLLHLEILTRDFGYTPSKSNETFDPYNYEPVAAAIVQHIENFKRVLNFLTGDNLADTLLPHCTSKENAIVKIFLAPIRPRDLAETLHNRVKVPLPFSILVYLSAIDKELNAMYTECRRVRINNDVQKAQARRRQEKQREELPTTKDKFVSYGKKKTHPYSSKQHRLQNMYDTDASDERSYHSEARSYSSHSHVSYDTGAYSDDNYSMLDEMEQQELQQVEHHKHHKYDTKKHHHGNKEQRQHHGHVRTDRRDEQRATFPKQDKVYGKEQKLMKDKWCQHGPSCPHIPEGCPYKHSSQK